MNKNKLVLAIPDLHIPFEHPDALEFLTTVRDVFEPTDVVDIGDEVDMHALSRYVADPDGYSPGDEYVEALKKLKSFYKEFPDVKVCTSNHTARPYRKAFDAGIPRDFLKSYKELLEAPKGWEWKDNWELDGVNYEHGEGFSGMYAARHIAINRMQSTVIGHVHAHASVIHIAPNHGNGIYGMNIGCLIDSKAYAFAYAKHARTKVSLGCGIIEDGIPIWLPMQLNNHGRWNGKL